MICDIIINVHSGWSENITKVSINVTEIQFLCNKISTSTKNYFRVLLIQKYGVHELMRENMESPKQNLENIVYYEESTFEVEIIYTIQYV